MIAFLLKMLSALLTFRTELEHASRNSAFPLWGGVWRSLKVGFRVVCGRLVVGLGDVQGMPTLLGGGLALLGWKTFRRNFHGTDTN